MIHCSASQEGLERSLQLVGDEGDVIEMSWYADRKVTLPLGEDFHARRLSIRASQVGVVARARRHRRTNADRLALAVSLLRIPSTTPSSPGPPRLRNFPPSSSTWPTAAWMRSATSLNTHRTPPKTRGSPCSA